MLSFSAEIGLACLEGSGALWHLQMVPSSRADVLFSLRFRGFCSSWACGFLLTFPPHPITNSLTILKEIAMPLALSPDTHKGSLEGLDRRSCSSCSFCTPPPHPPPALLRVWPTRPGRRASGLFHSYECPAGRSCWRSNQSLLRGARWGPVCTALSLHSGL